MVLSFAMVALADDGTLPEPPKRVLPAVAGAAFENADFEHGDFRNWPVHEGWVVRDIGPNADVTGDFSAYSVEGTWLTEFYLNRDINEYPKRLVSSPFIVTKRYLTFHLDGNPGDDNVHVGVDVDGDGEVDLKPVTRGFVPGRVAVDLSSVMGKTVSFVATVEKPKGKDTKLQQIALTVDELLLEDAPPVLVKLAPLTEKNGHVEGVVLLTNSFASPAQARLNLVVRDFWGKEVHRRRYNQIVKGKGNDRVGFKFPTLGKPQFRIDLAVLASNDQAIQSIHRRHYTGLLNEGRPALRLDEDGWTLALSKDKRADLPGKDAEWKRESVYKFNGPAYWRNGLWTKYEAFAQHWYKKDFTLPAGFTKGRTRLLVHGAFGPLAVFCNGKKTGEAIFKGFVRHTFDLTPHMQPGVNTVILRFRNPNMFGRDENLKPLYPYEARFKNAMLGIFGNLYVENVPDVWTDHVLIDPSWRKKKLDVRVVLGNGSGRKRAVTVRCAVFDPDGKELLRFAPAEVSVPPDGSTVACSQNWPDPVLWSPEHPNLLRLSVAVVGPNGKDTLNERFGFSEWYVDGTRYMLNGKQGTHFCGHDLDPERFTTSRRHHGMNSVRNTPSFDSPYVCDEQGITFRPIYNAGGNETDAFLAEQRRQTLAMMRMLYNHPANYLWVVGNERGVYVLPKKKLRDFYMALIREMQAIDPTRPSTSDGDLDVYGASNLWSVHYPHENKYAEPNRGYFVKAGVNLMDWFAHPPYQAKKPTMFTELFTGGLGGPDAYAPMMGNLAYTPLGPFEGYERFFNWRMRAYREQDVACFEPFEPFAYFRNFRPTELFLKDYSRNVFSGESMQIKAVLLHGGFEDREFQLVWHLEGADVRTRTVRLEPGHCAVEIPLSMPTVKQRTERAFSMWLLANGKHRPNNYCCSHRRQTVGFPRSGERGYERRCDHCSLADAKPFARWGRFDTTFKVFPRMKLNRRVACWNVSEKAKAMLKAAGLEPVPVSDAAALGAFQLLFAQAPLFGTPAGATVAQWVAGGGHAVILASEDEAGKLPGGLKLSKFSNTQAHIAAPNHPVLKGLGSTDFFHWAGGDHYVSHQAFLKPSGGAPKVLVENGTTAGLPLASLVEIQSGRGAYLVSSLLLSAKADREPVVGKLLDNIVAWAGGPKTPPVKAGLLVSDALQDYLFSENLIADDLACVNVNSDSLSRYPLLVVDTRIANADIGVLRQYVGAGGRLMLLRLTPDTIERFKPLLPGNLSLVKSDDSSITGATVLTAGPDPLIDGIGNYDMLWKRGHYQRGGPKFRITTLPANYDLVVRDGAASFTSLTAPAILGRFALGNGEVILSQFRWDEGLASEEKTGRILSTLLTNLGCGFQAAKTRERWLFTPAPMAGTCPLDGRRFPGLKGDIKLLAAPSRVLGEVPFQLPTPAGQVVALSANEKSGVPKSVTFEINSKASSIAFLHAASAGYVDYDMGKNVFRYLVTLKKGEKRWVEQANVIYASNVYEYLGDDPGTVKEATQVSASTADGVSAYLMVWKNPSPEATIERITVVSLDEEIGALVFGITLMDERGKRIASGRRRTGPFSVGELTDQSQDKPGRRWAVLGAIPVADRFGLNNTAISAEGARDLYDQAFEIEKSREVDVKAPVFIRGKRYTWKVFVEPEKVEKRGTDIKYRHVSLNDVIDKKYLGTNTNWACYLYTRIYRDIYGGAPTKTAIAFGSGDAAKIWVNGKPVHDVWAGAGRGATLGDDLVFVNMYRGWNDVLIKIVNTRSLAAFSFDLRKPEPRMEELWKEKGPTYLINLPELKAGYDCLSKRLHGDTQKTIPRVLRVTMRGQFHDLEGKATGLVKRTNDGVFHIDWFKGGPGGVSVNPPQKGPEFAEGTFGVMVRVPRGAAVQRTWVVSRNAGGSNRGDTFVRLTGGKPDNAHGGTDDNATPFTHLVMDIDPGPNASDGGAHEIKLPGKGLAEDVWQSLAFTWGKTGLTVYLNNKKIWSNSKVTAPMFRMWVPVSLFSGWNKMREGEICFQDAFLTDHVLTQNEMNEQLKASDR